ncbi:ATPase [Paramesorhizobium deserti]|uniref:ATPase n=1 Tax=Paramesorhizobium deserti TaxID=1494590 RepID=A0A135HXY8_9HYPH|nr:AAA family ATPase [Paramesorhizobium deserti]KXF78074.1 ATPase [Paramesorhizobium deserti]
MTHDIASHNSDRFFVFTGGPGSGKTTLLDALEQSGFARSVEAGRGIIQDQVKIDGNALPWKDRALFAEMMLSWEIRSYAAASQHDGPVLFDRGVPDVIGYLRLCGLPVPQHAHNAARAFRYNTRVFFAPPWREIFAQDTERKQSLEEAERTFHVMVEIYAALGYEPVMLPLANVGERVSFVLKEINAS